MRQVVDGLLYDTETAELIHEAVGLGWRKMLYKTRKGNFFIHWNTAPAYMGTNPPNIYPVAEEDVPGWLEENAPVAVLLSLFPDKVEEA